MLISSREEKRPLYLVEIGSDQLKERLIHAGIDVGDPIWIRSQKEERRTVWVKGSWGQVFINPQMSSNLLVCQDAAGIEEEKILDQIPVGESCRIVSDQFKSSDYKDFLERSAFSKKSNLSIIKHIPRLLFQVDIGGRTVEILDDIVFNIWCISKGQWSQLGSQVVGKEVQLMAYTGNIDIDADIFEIIKYQQSVRIKRIVVGGRDSLEEKEVKSQKGKIVKLTKNEAASIKVRLCDICWSCGLCKKDDIGI